VLGIPCEIWHEWDKGFREGPSSRLILSYDSGKSWPEASIMARDEEKESIYGDPRLTVTDDGRIIAMFWKYGLKTGADMPAHLVMSDDNGRTWCKPYNTGVIGQITSPYFLKNGNMLCITQKRFGAPGLKAIFSQDVGKTWKIDNEVTVWGTGHLVDNKNPFSGYQDYSFGYSSILYLNDEMFMVPFWCSNGKTTYIRILKVRVSIVLK
jgi:photosystem II stability/assembly factor-like uncharacterized protein